MLSAGVATYLEVSRVPLPDDVEGGVAGLPEHLGQHGPLPALQVVVAVAVEMWQPEPVGSTRSQNKTWIKGDVTGEDYPFVTLYLPQRSPSL